MLFKSWKPSCWNTGPMTVIHYFTPNGRKRTAEQAIVEARLFNLFFVEFCLLWQLLCTAVLRAPHCGPIRWDNIMHLSMYCPTYPPTGRRWGFDLILLKSVPQIRGIWSIFTNNRVKIYSPNGGIWSQYLLQGRGIWFHTDQIPTPCPWGGTWGNTLIGA